MPDRVTRRPVGPTPGALQDPATDEARRLPDAAEPDLEPGEELVFVLRGVGAAMFVTTDRLIVARDGGDRRPRSGTQSFSLESISHIRVEPGERTSGRVAVWIGAQEAVSMFFDGRSADRANEAVAACRQLLGRRRRERLAIARRIRD